MKNTEMESRGFGLPKLPAKLVDDHPIVATIIYLSPIIIPMAQKAAPAVFKGAKYLVDTVANCYRFKVMAENGIVVTNVDDDLETVSDKSVDA